MTKLGYHKPNLGNILLAIFYSLALWHRVRWKILPIYWKIHDQMVRYIGNYCNILPIFPPHSVPKGKGIFLLAIFYCPFGKFKLRHRPGYVINNQTWTVIKFKIQKQ
jgi:hypothetical protein